MKFPIVLNTTERFVEPGSLYYLVASNGIFQVRNTPTHRSVTRVERDIPGLLSETPRVDLNFPALPASLLDSVIAFFDEVYWCYRGEAIVILFFDPKTQEYRAEVPPQKITGYYDTRGQWMSDYRLDYENAERPDGFIRFGTIHSHANLAAYSSHTDCEDEKFDDGLHVVYGSFSAKELSRSASFVSNGQRFHVDADCVLETWAVSGCPVPDGWMDRVECVEEPAWQPRTIGIGSEHYTAKWSYGGKGQKNAPIEVVDDDGH